MGAIRFIYSYSVRWVSFVVLAVVVSAQAEDKSLVDYWNATKIEPTHLTSFVHDRNCQQTELNFVSCMMTVSFIASMGQKDGIAFFVTNPDAISATLAKPDPIMKIARWQVYVYKPI